MANAFTRGFNAVFKPIESKTEKRTDTSLSYPIPNLTVTPPVWGDFSTSLVTVDQALSLPAVARSVDILTTAVSQLDLDVKRGGTVIDSMLIAQPDRERTLSSFLKRTMHDLTTQGNAYWKLTRNSDGAVVNITALNPTRVGIFRDGEYTKFYQHTDHLGQVQTFTNNQPLTNTGQIEHIKIGDHDNHEYGRGPIQLNNAALYSAIELRYYLDRYIRESKRPSGIYSNKGRLDYQELVQAKAQIQANRTTGEPDVLDGDWSYMPVIMTPEATQYVELYKGTVLEIARMFGIPAPLLSSGIDHSSMTYQNLLTVDMQFVRYTLEKYLTSVEDAFSNVLPRGQTAFFDTDGWLRASVVLAGSAASATAPQDATDGDTE